MDVDMDMDADELEWLSYQQKFMEDEEQEQFQGDPDEEEQLLDFLEQNHNQSTLQEEIDQARNQANRSNSGKRPFPLPDEEEDAEKRRRKLPDALPFVDHEWIDIETAKEQQEHHQEEENIINNNIEQERNEQNLPRRMASEVDGECISITGPTGERVYSKLIKESTESVSLNTVIPSQGLLSVPIHALLAKVDQEMFEQVCNISTEIRIDEKAQGHEPANEQLWVDKYAPKSFTELLSDERTNREVLHWLKQWDHCAFGTTNTLTSSNVLSALRRHSSHSQNQKFFGYKMFTSNGVQDGLSKRTNFGPESTGRSNISEGNDELNSHQFKKQKANDSRPDEKILLLCGPPGLGKTTLAHVAARHCGYHVVEINASDDRSEAVMESKILDVVQMNSITSNSKPKCLIIDEIDGALGDGKGAVEILMKMVSSERKSAIVSENEGSTQATNTQRRKGSKKAGRLLRPIICICNDISAPALRSLRQVARVHMFTKPTTNRVVSRLKYICNKEGFKTSAQGLTALAEFTDCDIRACLNTLQFLNRKKEILNAIDISSQVVGRKDKTNNIFDVWKEVLHKSKPKGQLIKSERKDTGSFTELHDKVMNYGDYDLLGEGIHENFLNMKYNDSAMEKTVKCLDLLCNSDIFRRNTMQSQKFYLNVYQPSIVVSIRNLVAQVEKPNIEWPKSHQRWRQLLNGRKDLVTSWLNSISPIISKYLSVKSVVEDIVSSLLSILTPPLLKPVASQLLAGKEHKEINDIVDTMVDYAITYKKIDVLAPNSYHGHHQHLEFEGFNFSPSINELVNFKDYTPKHYMLSTAMQQILSNEVEKQKLKKESQARKARADELAMMLETASISDTHSSAEGVANGVCKEAPTPMSIDSNSKKSLHSLTSSEQNNLSKGISGIDKPKFDEKKKRAANFNFFERFRSASQIEADTMKNSFTNIDTSGNMRKLLFKFNEGFTNAVKRPVRMKELL